MELKLKSCSFCGGIAKVYCHDGVWRIDDATAARIVENL